MKDIPYIKKVTQANTEYRKTTSSDLNWILSQSQRLVDVANDCANHGLKEGSALLEPNPKMPRQSSGKRNTPKSLCEGVIDNLHSGQYNLSNKQCDGLIEAFRIGNDIIEDFEDITFTQVESLPKIQAPNIEMNNIKNTIFQELFDIQSITVTYSKR